MADVQIPKKHKAAVYDKPGSISTKIEELDVPEPGPGEVLINLYVPFSSLISHTRQNQPLPVSLHTDIPRSSHSGVCHSDMGIMLNAWKTLPFPTQAGQVGGHEGVGKIVKMGPGTENAAVKLGDRVGVKWMAGICEACEACRAGMDASCFNGVRIHPSIHPPISPKQVH
jgi:propanol-preferring alcohol dehydrogenase